jgi:hypothetical protein
MVIPGCCDRRLRSDDKCGAQSYSVRPWLLNEGTVTVKLTYSDGKREVI